MTRFRQLLFLCFIESFATILIERAVYFYTQDVLGYGEAKNLLLALVLGVGYVAGAFSSHSLTKRLSERRVLFLTVSAQWLIHLVLFLFPSPWTLGVGMMLIGLVNGMKWPVLESYISAGKTPKIAAKAIGSFNTAWATAVPLSLLVAGPIIGLWAPGIFLIALMINSVTLVLALSLPQSPDHLTHDHPERLPEESRLHYKKLLTASRWTMVSSYTLTFLLAPLLPGVFSRLSVPLVYATGLSSLMDIMRVVLFYLLRQFHQWHGKTWPVILALALLPLGFFMTLFGSTLWIVLSGEIFFGIAGAICYYAALYYAMVVSNASVDAGGAHEGLIGIGFSLGPALGLAAGALALPIGNTMLAMVLTTVPFLAASSWLAGRALKQSPRRDNPTDFPH